MKEEIFETFTPEFQKPLYMKNENFSRKSLKQFLVYFLWILESLGGDFGK